MRGVSVRGGALGACLTTALVSLGVIDTQVPDPIERAVNDNDELLAYWESEDPYSPPDAVPECVFFNASIRYTSQLCSHFVLSRPSSSPVQSFDRARRCASRFETRCILSAEVGLSIPAAFYTAPDENEGMRMIIGPRILNHPDKQNMTTRLIRVKTPGSTFGSRTVEFDHSLLVEYLDGYTRSSKQRMLEGDEAYCVQLLRMAFVDSCWAGLD
jgi:hypothetical protein